VIDQNELVTRAICEQLDAGSAVALVSIINTEGSAQGTPVPRWRSTPTGQPRYGRRRAHRDECDQNISVGTGEQAREADGVRSRRH